MEKKIYEQPIIEIEKFDVEIATDPTTSNYNTQYPGDTEQSFSGL